MELCKKVQAEEYVIHVEESPNLYTSLRFFLLASPWFPRPLGLALWSVLHTLLLLYMTLMLLAMFSIVVAFAVWCDAFMLCWFVLVICPVLGLLLWLLVVFSWIWLLISCNVPWWEPGQSLANYILTAGGELNLTQTPPVEEQTDAPYQRDLCVDYFQTVKLFNRLKLVSIPYWRVNLGSLCREIVPTYDAVVI